MSSQNKTTSQLEEKYLFENEECVSENLTCLNVNIRSLSKHFDELQALLITKTMKPTVIGLTETWLETNDMAKMFRLKGYHKLITCNRDWGKRGGVGFYIDDKLKFRVLLKDTTREWLMV